MPTYLLVELADDGTASATTLTDPITVTEPVDIPLASLIPAPAPAAEPVDPNAPPA
jgi:hypothetical protein